MSTLVDYFRPDNRIALAIVVLLWTVFAIWGVALIAAGLRVARYSAVIRALNAIVPDLAAARIAGARLRSRGEIPETTPAEEFRTYLPAGMSHRQPVVHHLESIYSAGCTDSRLDIRELLDHTERSVGGSDAARRSFLSIFLIIGLLGTLFGLADSILALLKLLQQNTDAGTNLVALLGALKGAFAPSISGVLTSILGTVAYAVYQRDWFAPLAGSLREVTLNLWVPELYPTTGQEAAEAAQASLDAAIKVTESAQTIREDTVALAATLRSVETDTNKYAVGMKELASQVHGSIDPAAAAIRDLGSQLDRFNQAMTRWNDFETALKVLYSKLEAGQSLLIEQAGTVRTQIDLQTTEFQSMAAGLRDTHKLIFAEVRDRMNGLQVPFKDAAAQMLDQAEILRLFAQKVVETSDKTALQLHADYEKTATALSDIAAKLVLVATAEARTSQLGETLRSGLDQQQVAATRFEALANRVLTALESGSQRQADLLGAIEANLRASREWSPVAMGEAAYGAGARPTYAAPPPSTYPAQPSRSYPDPVRHPPDLQRAASAAPFAPSQQPVPFSQAQPRLPATKWQPGPSRPPSSPPDEVKRPWWRLGL